MIIRYASEYRSTLVVIIENRAVFRVFPSLVNLIFVIQFFRVWEPKKLLMTLFFSLFKINFGGNNIRLFLTNQNNAKISIKYKEKKNRKIYQHFEVMQLPKIGTISKNAVRDNTDLCPLLKYGPEYNSNSSGWRERWGGGRVSDL